jgi:SnoaL-like polyketide cyclase
VGTNPAAGADRVLERLHRAMNEHDVEGFLANVDADYRSEQPAHTERAFGGREQVRENWEAIFRDVPSASSGGRLYVEMIETGGGDIREAVGRMTAGQPGAESSAGGAGEAKPSDAEKNRVVARPFGDEVWGRGDVQAADEVLAEDFIEHRPAPGQGPGREGHKQVLKVWRAAFPISRSASTTCWPTVTGSSSAGRRTRRTGAS